MQSGESRPQVLVTAENFRRAESDMYFGNTLKEGGLGKFAHNRELTPISKQLVIRSNRDTLYSFAVFDLDAGEVTVTLPDAGKRFMSMQLIDEDQYSPAVFYAPGSYNVTKQLIPTRYVMVGIRTLVDPANPQDVKQVHALQDAIKVNQKSAGQFEVPAWDVASQKKIRDALLVLGATLPDSKRTFGARNEVDPVRHLIGTAAGWGGNPEKEATYLNFTPPNNDGVTSYRVKVKEVPVDGFWSISIYNAEGYFEPNPDDAYTLNNITAKKDADGAVTVQFGGSKPDDVNWLPIMSGWNCLIRLYRPRPEILNGSWKFPVAQPVSSSQTRAA